MADSISDAGYALIFVSCVIIMVLYLPWFLFSRRMTEQRVAHRTVSVDKIGRSENREELPHSRKDCTNVENTQIKVRTPIGLTIHAHCLIGFLGTLCAAAGNIMAYRIVLSEHLLGTILTKRGPVGVITTLLISLALLFLAFSHCVLFGSNAIPARPVCLATAECAAVGLTLIIILGKFSMGIVHYNVSCCACP